MKKISIIIPVFNAENFIVETLESIINQTFTDIEIICIDDGSTDGSLKIMKDYSSRLDYMKVYSQKNQGQSATRNNALQYVEGEYISFVDADDILLPDCLEKLYNEIVLQDADIAICGYEKFYDESDEIFYIRNPKRWEVQFDHGFSHVFHYSPCAKLFRTDFIKKYDIKFSVGEQLEDGPYNCMTNLLANKVAVLDYIGYKYRTYNTSTMGKVRGKNSKPRPPYNGILTLIKTFKRFNNDVQYEEVMEYTVIKIMAGLTTNMYKNIDSTSRKEVCKYCHDIMTEYFPDAKKNPYIKIHKLKQLPLSHRVAVRLFVFFNGINKLFFFSSVVSKVL